MGKLDDRRFCYFTAAMFVSLRGAQTWRLHTKLCTFEWNTSPNNGRMKNCTGLNLGEVVFISVIFHIPVSWLNLSNSYDFYFWWRDTANQPFATIRHYSRLFATIRTIRTIRYSLFGTIPCSLFATIRYSLFGFSRHPKTGPVFCGQNGKFIFFICESKM